MVEETVTPKGKGNYAFLKLHFKLWHVRGRNEIRSGPLYSRADAPWTQVHQSPQYTKDVALTQPKRLVS